MYNFDGQMFHVGMLVTDLDAAMDDIGRAHNVTWSSVRDWPMDVWLPDQGYISMDIRLAFSQQGPVRLEIIQGSPNTPVDPAQGTGVHHIGYFVDDPAAETQRMLDEGGTLVMAAASPEDGFGRFTYVRTPSGLLVEPVAASSRERFEAWWAGGDLKSSASK